MPGSVLRTRTHSTCARQNKGTGNSEEKFSLYRESMQTLARLAGDEIYIVDARNQNDCMH